jgi:hypothetical protein
MTIKTQIPFSATHFDPDRGCWWREPNVTQRGWHRLISTGWYDAGIDFPAQTLTPVRSLDTEHFEHPKTAPVSKAIDVPVWDGTGLPPVGTVCEFAGFNPEETMPTDPRAGDQVTVIAHFMSGSFEVAAFIFYAPPGFEYFQVAQGAYGCFRPIRTPEQIAAEEREKAIGDMEKTTNWQITQSSSRALYDAGYRKMVKS